MGIRYALGAMIGLPIAGVIFVYALVTRKRAFHPYAVVCDAEVTAIDPVIGARLAGPASVRLGPAMKREVEAGQDVLAMAIRFRRPGEPLAAEADLRRGDQDVIVASMERFGTIFADRARTDITDYLGNEYSSVSWWQIDGVGIGRLRAIPLPPTDPGRAPTRLERLDADIAAGRARFTLEARQDGAPPRPIAELALTRRLDFPGNELRISMYRRGRGLRPTGMINGIRSVVYPVSQVGRRVLGG